jgi:hypothetical protein
LPPRWRTAMARRRLWWACTPPACARWSLSIAPPWGLSRGRTPRWISWVRRKIDRAEVGEDGSWPQPATVARPTIFIFKGSENTRVCLGVRAGELQSAQR